MDPAPITRHLRAMYSSRLLIAAVSHLHVFEHLAEAPLSMAELQGRLALKERPAMVLFPALCAMGMLEVDGQGKFRITELGRFLTFQAVPNLIGYVGLEQNDPGVLEMAFRLKNDGPAKQAEGIAYVKEGEEPSPMDNPASARILTLALAGRAQYLAPIVAGKMSQREGHLLDIAGGTGFYTYEWLLLNPHATATILDRPQVLAVAAELLDTFSLSGRVGASRVKERVTFLPGDMLADKLPPTDLILAASLFHDWPTDTCIALAKRFASALKPGGEVWIHDAFLDDTLDGPLAVTDYSAQLFWVTKGRAYSRKEYRDWLSKAGMVPKEENTPTQMDYGLISARKPE
ncbi:MAG: methyltransferase [Bacteroidota bacterium]